MTKVLMIVESPVKAKKIKGYFPHFDLMATLGHFKDLPKSGMGVEPPEHKPEYVVIEGKQQIITKLRAAAKTADVIYVASDPDREGEAIAAHVVNTLGRGYVDKIARITYSEITKSAIETAIKRKRQINWWLVRAQEARRVLDRYIGYLVSPELTGKFKQAGYPGNLAAGRVVSVTTRLIVERQEEIQRFVPIAHYGVTATLIKAGLEFEVQWRPDIPPKTLMTNRATAEAVVQRTHRLNVLSLDKKPEKKSPPPPLITTTFTRMVSTALKLTTKQAMDAAQKLHEHGLITYHRTDSPAMDPNFATNIREFATRNKLPIPPQAREFKAKANAQEAHECLRVSDIDLINPRAAGVEDETLKAVYQLIWLRTLESQLADSIDNVVHLAMENTAGDKFGARAKQLTFAGWKAAAQQFFPNSKVADESTPSEETEAAFSLPELTPGESLTALKVEVKEKKTEPPSVFNEDTLVEQLEKLGIGRPSTYAATIERMVALGYVSRDKKLRLTPEPLGIAATQSLKNEFSFMGYQFTAEIETAMDDIAERKQDYVNVVDGVWNKLNEEINRYRQTKAPDGIPSLSATRQTGEAKPTSATRKTTSSKTSKSITKAKAGAICPTCSNGTLTTKKIGSGANAGKSFLGCSKFPDCKHFEWSK